VTYPLKVSVLSAPPLYPIDCHVRNPVCTVTIACSQNGIDIWSCIVNAQPADDGIVVQRLFSLLTAWTWESPPAHSV
jgi:hypothetical protein